MSSVFSTPDSVKVTLQKQPMTFEEIGFSRTSFQSHFEVRDSLYTLVQNQLRNRLLRLFSSTVFIQPSRNSFFICHARLHFIQLETVWIGTGCQTLYLFFTTLRIWLVICLSLLSYLFFFFFFFFSGLC